MKLVAVSVVKNEADVIEACVRHAAAWVDHQLIFDHASTDGTRELLGALARERPAALTLYTGDALDNLQQSRSNHLAALAFAEHGADWVLPLDADEFPVVPGGRAGLEAALAAVPADRPACLPLRNYTPTPADDPREPNPLLRLRHAQPGVSPTCKILIPRSLGLRPDLRAGKGNHALYAGDTALPGHALPGAWLAHFALRSPHQQALRVVTAELQKLARGRAHDGLDLHYRLGFQLLAEDPARFFATVVQPPERLALDPAPYLGAPLRYSAVLGDLARTSRALLSFLEQLALSHGRLRDRLPTPADTTPENIRRLDPASLPALVSPHDETFSGFLPTGGWEPLEGPVPEAFLPPFHWATGPETNLSIPSPAARLARLDADVLTYAAPQELVVCLNGLELHRQPFPRVNQKERLALTLPLQAGDNHLVFRSRVWIESAADPRRLALIFLRLVIL